MNILNKSVFRQNLGSNFKKLTKNNFKMDYNLIFFKQFSSKRDFVSMTHNMGSLMNKKFNISISTTNNLYAVKKNNFAQSKV